MCGQPGPPWDTTQRADSSSSTVTARQIAEGEEWREKEEGDGGEERILRAQGWRKKEEKGREGE